MCASSASSALHVADVEKRVTKKKNTPYFWPFVTSVFQMWDEWSTGFLSEVNTEKISDNVRFPCAFSLKMIRINNSFEPTSIDTFPKRMCWNRHIIRYFSLFASKSKHLITVKHWGRLLRIVHLQKQPNVSACHCFSRCCPLSSNMVIHNVFSFFLLSRNRDGETLIYDSYSEFVLILFWLSWLWTWTWRL